MSYLITASFIGAALLAMAVWPSLRRDTRAAWRTIRHLPEGE